MKLHKLKNVSSAKLVLPLKDYAGQPLVFHPAGDPPFNPLSRRLVRSDVFEHGLVQRYIRQQVLVEEKSVGHDPAKSRKLDKPAPAPEPKPEVVVAPEPEPEPEVVAEPEPEPEPDTEESTDDENESAAEEKETPKPRRRRRKKS
jgi:outer membrane biosynthesis protein TonB